MRKVTRTIVSLIVISTLLSQTVLADINNIKIPYIGKLASDAAEGIAGAADKAGEAVSGVADKAGKLATDAVQQAGDIAGGLWEKAGILASDWGRKAGETADGIKESLSDAGVKIQTTASELGKATADRASEMVDMAGGAASDAIDAVKGAGNIVIDQAGHVVDLAEAGAAYVSGAAGEAVLVLQEKGTVLMELAQEAVANIDLSDEQNWDKAKSVIEDTIDEAYDSGIIDIKLLQPMTSD